MDASVRLFCSIAVWIFCRYLSVFSCISLILFILFATEKDVNRNVDKGIARARGPITGKSIVAKVDAPKVDTPPINIPATTPFSFLGSFERKDRCGVKKFEIFEDKKFDTFSNKFSVFWENL